MEINYRNVSPGDMILIYGEPKVIERVDRTHIATRGPKDTLELWGYGEDLRAIKLTDTKELIKLGFRKGSKDHLFKTIGKYKVEISPGDSSSIMYIYNLAHKNDETICLIYRSTLNDAQCMFYEETKQELL